ncbi:head maturation protease [Haloarcula californiae tailed virus 2]|uniref:Prohead protease n=1 Tax=Haloarcula californiae tailed virus 2 TaxID=1273747 RepID=R4TNK1_9CAUD|nr:head maturation protease [Haloarcula californiae tailed virus 2]AGM11803.1 prohead protease [Haloarcula californiae tailed virus 2]
MWRRGPRTQMPEDNAEQQKPVGPFDDFEACVRHFEDDPDVEDPEGLCGWMEENKEASAVQQYQPSEDEVQDLVDAMKEPAADTVLTDLQVTYVSGVGDPAQDSQWVMAKDASTEGADWGVNAPLVLQKGATPVALDEPEDEGDEGEQKKAWAPVLIPNETDKQGDVIPAEAIEKAAHEFLSEYRNIDTDHDLLEGKGVPIESWTLKEEDTFTLPDGSESRQYPKGTWMLGVKFGDEAWQRVKDGELTGFSIYGEATEHSVQDLLGGGVEMEVGGVPTQFQATAKEADGGNTDMSENENENTDGEGTEKQMPADAVPILVDTINAYLASEDEDLGASLEDWLQWGLDTGEIEADELVVGGEELTASGGGGGEDEGTDEGGENEGEGGPEQPPEEQEMSENPEGEDGESSTSTKELLEDVRDTVKSTQESVEQHGDRIEALESEVFEKDTEGGEAEGEGSEKEQPDPEQVQEQATEAAETAAAKQVKDLLGLEELPDDPEERQKVVRKHLHEQPEDSGLGDPDAWTNDEVSEVVK